jgi:hypothetical protein
MSELQEVCDALNAINGAIVQMAHDLHDRSRAYNSAAASAAAASRSAEGRGAAALAQTAAALSAAATHCRQAALSLVGAANEGRAFVHRTTGSAGQGGASSSAQAAQAEPQDDPPGPMETELHVLRGPHPNRQQVGDFSEAVAAGFLNLLLDYDLIFQHNPGDKPQGLDIAAINPSEGRLQTVEVKGTTLPNAGRPRTSKTKTGRQASAEWIRSRSADGPVYVASTDAVGDGPDQIGSRLVHVNLTARTISLWRVDKNGIVASTPDVMAPLDEVVHAIDWPSRQ